MRKSLTAIRASAGIFARSNGYVLGPRATE